MEENWLEINRNMALGEVKELDKLIWYDPRKEPFRISGLYWLNQNKSFARFPDEAFDMLADIAPGVYFMAKNSAGGQIAFETDAERIVIHAVLESAQRNDHIAATGEMGMDCYIAYPGEDYGFEGVTRFDARKNEYTCEVLSNRGKEHKRVIINMPLYKPLLKLEIGLPNDAHVHEPMPFASKDPIIVYGTSITQGGCVSRPGAMSTNILSRRLNMEFLNFGFSGSGKGEPEIAQLISQVENPTMFILEYEANAGTLIYENLKPFLSILRQKHPNVPILLCSALFFYKLSHFPWKLEELTQRRAFQKKTVDELRADGDNHIYFVDGWKLLEKNCSDCFIDGIHPSDLGARQIADSMEQIIRKHLKI